MSSIEETLARAKARHGAGELALAAQLYQQVLDVDAAHAETHFLLGAARHGLGQSQEAIASLTQALRLQPDHAEANHQLGVVLAQNGRLDEAASFCQRAVELKPDLAEAYANLAAILTSQEKVEAAVECRRRALELAAHSADAGRAYESMLKFLELGQQAFPPSIKLLLARTATKDWRLLDQLDWLSRGNLRSRQWPLPEAASEAPQARNPLREYFTAHHDGPGIWKWLHYFEIYDRHFRRFRDREVYVLEIGIYSGGSLPMWKEYFGRAAQIYGVDIEPSCKAYEDDRVRVFIGDQADRAFWQRFKGEVPKLDIVIDDGGHAPEQQIATLEELLPHLRPGGVFLCEDVHGQFNRFASYINGMLHELNAAERFVGDPDNHARRLSCQPTGFQSAIDSIHSYPFVTVIEKRETPLTNFVAPKQGTQWEPFLR